MKILVCIRQVPDTEASIKLADDKNVSEAGIKFIVNPYSEYALEEAVKLKEAGMASTVTAISWGPERVKEALRTAVAMGVDEVLHLKFDDYSIDGYAASKLLANKIKDMEYDLILMGKENIDDGNMVMGPMLGELLGIPCIPVVTKLDVQSGSVTAECEIEGGVQVVQAPTPCIVTCQKGLNEPRYPSIRGVMMAKKKQIPEEAVRIDASLLPIESLTYPPTRKEGKVVGEGAAAAEELVRLLRDEAKVL